MLHANLDSEYEIVFTSVQLQRPDLNGSDVIAAGDG